MPQNQSYQTENTAPQNPAQAIQVQTPYNMPQQTPAQNILSGMMGGIQPGPRWVNWTGFENQQPQFGGTPEYEPLAANRRATPQMVAPVPGAPQAPNPQYPGTSGQITGQQPVPPPSTQPDMNSVMNNLVSGAAQNLGGAQGQPQIHPAIQQFQGMVQGIQNNPQMLQALFGAMPGGLQGFMNMIQPLMGAIPTAGPTLIGPGQKPLIANAGPTLIGPGASNGGGGNLSQGALAMLKGLHGDRGKKEQNLVQIR